MKFCIGDTTIKISTWKIFLGIATGCVFMYLNKVFDDYMNQLHEQRVDAEFMEHSDADGYEIVND